MKILNVIIFTFFISHQHFAQVSTSPNGMGVGVNNPTIPLHINKPGEVVRLEGTAPYLTLSNATNWQGYLQATATGKFEIGTKNSSDMTFFTSDLQRMSINGTTGRVSFSDGIRVTGSLQALGGSSGALGQVLISNGAGTPFWGDNYENPQIGFMANYNSNFILNAGTAAILNGLNEVYDNSPSGGSFDPSLGLFIAPSPGVYHFTLNLGFNWTHVGSNTIFIDINKNGIPVKTMFKAYSDNSFKTDSDSYGFDISLNAGDQVNLQLQANTFQISLLNSSSLIAKFEFSGFKVY